MSERYTKLFTLPARLYAEGSPVIIEAGALSKDNDTGRVFAQLRFRNISDKAIIALSVSLNTFFVSGEQTGEPVKHQYLDINCNVNEDFGSKEPIIFAENTTRSFSVHLDKVVYSDNSVDEVNLDFSDSLPVQNLLKNTLGWNKEISDEFGLMTNEQCIYSVENYKDLWLCSCGGVNKIGRDSVCRKCSTERDRLLSVTPEEADIHRKDRIYNEALNGMHSQNISELTAIADSLAGIFDWKDASEKLADCKEKIENLNNKKAKEKKNKLIIISLISLVSVCVCVGIIILAKNVIIPNNNYNNALKLMQSGDYEQAESVFSELKDYKDSTEKIAECNEIIKEEAYKNAVKMMEDKNFEDAISIFSELKDYKNSADKIAECNELKNEETYNNALKLLEDGDLDKAKSLFSGLGDYKDSALKVDECNNSIKENSYIEAVKYMEADNFDKAILSFSQLGDYKDSADRLAECKKLKGTKENNTSNETANETANDTENDTAGDIADNKSNNNPSETKATDTRGESASSVEEKQESVTYTAPEGKEAVFNFYKTAANKIAENGAAGYTKKEWQALSNLNLSGLSSVDNTIINLAGNYMTKEADARNQVFNKGTADARSNFPACSLTDMSKVASATCTVQSNGNYKIVITMVNEDTPKKTSNFLGKVTNSILYWEDIDTELKNISAIKSYTNIHVIYEGFKIEAEMTPAGNFVSLNHLAGVNIKIGEAKVLVATLKDKSGHLDNTCKYTNFNY
jgi:outer membrane protein assembly factor BamD (BamD/ComL family)